MLNGIQALISSLTGRKPRRRRSRNSNKMTSGVELLERRQMLSGPDDFANTFDAAATIRLSDWGSGAQSGIIEVAGLMIG